MYKRQDYVVYRPNSTSEKPIYGLPVNYTVNAYPKDTYIDSINTEFQRFLDQGIKVYFTYSPRNKYALSEDSTQEERIRLHEYFKSQLNVPVISELEDSLYTGIYLYGTDNHLSTEGHRSGPVSYTHLDVYKRQIVQISTNFLAQRAVRW